MLTYELDAKNSRSLYEQLYQAIRSDIELARLDAGSKLPSKRTLAQHLGSASSRSKAHTVNLLPRAILKQKNAADIL